MDLMFYNAVQFPISRMRLQDLIPSVECLYISVIFDLALLGNADHSKFLSLVYEHGTALHARHVASILAQTVRYPGRSDPQRETLRPLSWFSRYNAFHPSLSIMVVSHFSAVLLNSVNRQFLGHMGENFMNPSMSVDTLYLLADRTRRGYKPYKSKLMIMSSSPRSNATALMTSLGSLTQGISPMEKHHALSEHSQCPLDTRVDAVRTSRTGDPADTLDQD